MAVYSKHVQPDWLKAISSGEKTIEGRLDDHPFWGSNGELKEGDELILTDGTTSCRVKVVKRHGPYEDFNDCFKEHGVKMIPESIRKLFDVEEMSANDVYWFHVWKDVEKKGKKLYENREAMDSAVVKGKVVGLELKVI